MRKLVMCTFILLLLSSKLYAANGVVKTDESSFRHFKYGMTSSLLSLLYTPLKVNVAMVGGIVGGLAYPFSGFNPDASKKIWDKSLGGTYLITENILKGEDKLELFFSSSRTRVGG